MPQAKALVVDALDEIVTRESLYYNSTCSFLSASALLLTFCLLSRPTSVLLLGYLFVSP